MSLTKNVKMRAPYQQWTISQITAGDILDFYTSLGNRYPTSILVESIGGETVIRFNVSHSVFREAGPMNESWVGLGQGGNRPLPLEVNEVEIAQPDWKIEAGATMSWTIQDIAAKDMKVVTLASGLKVSIT